MTHSMGSPIEDIALSLTSYALVRMGAVSLF